MCWLMGAGVWKPYWVLPDPLGTLPAGHYGSRKSISEGKMPVGLSGWTTPMSSLYIPQIEPEDTWLPLGSVSSCIEKWD